MQANYNSTDGFKEEALPFIMYNPENKRKFYFLNLLVYELTSEAKDFL